MIGVELVKLLRRPRTWITVVLTCALPFMVAVFITISHLVPPPGQGSAFLSAVLQNGALYPAAALNARLVGAGLRVSSIGPQQRTLEEIVLAVTGAGSDQVS